MDKFEIYAFRNIFVQDIVQSNSADNRVSKRQRYHELMIEHDILKKQCSVSESAVGDMRNAIFTYRIGQQALDSYDVNPIADTISNIKHSSDSLQQISNRANGNDFFLFYSLSLL